MSDPAIIPLTSVSSLYIPQELLDKILSFCRPSTLAAASRVSSACLELASPWLYTDIVVRDLDSIIKLFRLSSDRATSRTSLSLIHSITVVLGKLPIDFSPLRDLALPPPLALTVFVVSTPGPNSSLSSRIYDLSPIALLVNPRTFVVRGRQSKLDSIHFRPAIVMVGQAEEYATTRYWDRIKIALLHGASVNVWNLIDSRHSEVQTERSPPLSPLRMIVDLVSAPEKQFAISEHANYFVGRDSVILSSARREVSLKAWVGSEASKKALEEKMKPIKRTSTGPSEHADVEVISERIRRFRDDLALGAWKAMDWAVLDDA